MAELGLDDQTPGAFDLDRGFDDAELAICLKVLRALGGGVGVSSDASDKSAAAESSGGPTPEPTTTDTVHQSFHHPRHKQLRVALQPLLSGLKNQLGHYGGDPKAFRASKQSKRDLNRRKMQEKAFDRDAQNKTAMRSARLARLGDLQKERTPTTTFALGNQSVNSDDETRATSAVRIPGVPDGCFGKSAQWGDDNDGDDDETENVQDDIATETPTTLHQPRQCYTCKARFTTLHLFYAQLCPPCASLNWEKRKQKCDLAGRVFLVTGARVKIGLRITLKLLRCGGAVVATTRFPVDARRRFLLERDSDTWCDRLTIIGMDLRDLPGLEKLCLRLCDTLPRLDGIVNNACQTVRRPPAYYEHLLQAEAEGARAYLTGAGEPEQGITKFGQSFLVAGVADAPGGTTDATEDETGPNPEGTRVSSGVPSECVTSTSDAWRDSTAPLSLKSTGWMAPSASQSQLNVLRSDAEANGASHFPAGALDVNEQQIDLRLKTSWTTKLGEVETPELLEVLAVNTAAPFVLNGKLKALMARTVLGGAPYGRETSTSSDTSASESQDLREKSAQETHPQYSNTPKPGRGRAFIVNVSAMEGKFYRYKTCNHPHTNMAKAALNMMTATSAGEYAEHGIYMNAVDTGWINDENPRHVAARIAHDQNFQTPIDEEDAAARCAAPILEGFRDTSTEPPFGKFFKDYKESEW